jgi:class 3 adenylate cyclase
MEETAAVSPLSLSASELSSIDEYRKKKNTAVLTIMFTDIQGFTALTEDNGESYVHDLHQKHDRILVETIEENNAGIVIKYIGDSIMAVFSEPTAAAEKALRIQERLHAFNEEHPGQDRIEVRIGLHMGQTVIENKMQTDLFGRHVNKASRVEGLAAGGHIYISYPVFDSIKSWILDSPGAGWKFHGSYFLKGIGKAEEIYEIYNKAFTQPQAPRKAKKKGQSGLLVPLLAAILVLAGAATALLLVQGRSGQAARPPSGGPPAMTGQAPGGEAPAGTMMKAATGSGQPGTGGEAVQPAQQAASAPAAMAKAPAMVAATPPEVFMLGMIAREPMLDFDGQPLAVMTVDEAQGLKKSITELSPGRHAVHYVVSYMVHYYAVFDVKPGKNVIQIAFKRSELPGVQINYSLPSAEASGSSESLEDEEAYFFIDHKSFNRIDRVGKPSAQVRATRTAGGRVDFDIHYSLVLDGATVVDKVLKVEAPADKDARVDSEPLTVYEDEYHAYSIHYHLGRDWIQFEFDAGFKDKG